jgi:Asp-tRNA(Asn)/Glu-tRNA(Gln) amidotransferase A subunit family amidase
VGELPLAALLIRLERVRRIDPQPVCTEPIGRRLVQRVRGAGGRAGTIAVGTETNGSIVCPAAVNGVVGIKPGVGLIPQQGIVPISHSQDTAGPMALTVREAAELLTVLTGGETDYAAACDGRELAGVRLGVPRETEPWGFTPALDELTEQALELLSKAGATIVDELTLPDTDHEEQLAVLYLPVAVIFGCTQGSEARLIRIARAFESARDSEHGLIPSPEFLPWL